MTAKTDHPLDDILTLTSSIFESLSTRIDPKLEVRETGAVLDIDSGIARVSGLPGLCAEELVQFSSGAYGIATDLNANSAGIILLDESTLLRAGMSVTATGRIADTPVGDALIGRVVDAVGRPLDAMGSVNCKIRRPIERDAPSIMSRAPVTRPLETGIRAIDALIPIGRGQRELILGDRQTGKTSVAIDAILNQRDNNVVCIYCSIGQRGTATARVIDTLREYGAMAYTLVVVASGYETPGMQYITPYAATTKAEHFRDQGRDVLIVYDDLTRHARV
jgi:F-type H+-transporting ATPase subunit alpha